MKQPKLQTYQPGMRIDSWNPLLVPKRYLHHAGWANALPWYWPGVLRIIRPKVKGDLIIMQTVTCGASIIQSITKSFTYTDEGARYTCYPDSGRARLVKHRQAPGYPDVLSIQLTYDAYKEALGQPPGRNARWRQT